MKVEKVEGLDDWLFKNIVLNRKLIKLQVAKCLLDWLVLHSWLFRVGRLMRKFKAVTEEQKVTLSLHIYI